MVLPIEEMLVSDSVPDEVINNSTELFNVKRLSINVGAWRQKAENK